MFTSMLAGEFDLGAPLDRPRAIIRRDGLEMVELPWGLQPRDPGGRPLTVIRAEGRSFPSYRCLVPASGFRFRIRGRHYTFSLVDGDWFYFAGIWRAAARDWPEAYAILTIEANPDISPYHGRQMAVLRRNQRLEWLDATRAQHDLLQPQPLGSFCVRQDHGAAASQGSLAL